MNTPFFDQSEFSNLHYEFTGNRIDQWNSFDSSNDLVKQWIDSLTTWKICYKCNIPFKESETLGSLPCVTHYGLYALGGWPCCKRSMLSPGCIPCAHQTQSNVKLTKKSRIEIPNNDVFKIPEKILTDAIRRGKVYGTFEQTPTSICFYNIDREKIRVLENNSSILSFREGHDILNHGRLGVSNKPYNNSSHLLFRERFGNVIDYTTTRQNFMDK